MRLDEDIFELFGEVKFGEIDNMLLNDFDRSLNRYFSKKRTRHGKYRFITNNSYISEFESYFESYFY